MGEGGPGPPALALKPQAQVRCTLSRLLLLPHFEASEQLNQPDVPLLRQEEEEEAQADDDDGNYPDTVENDLTGVAVNHCRRQRTEVTQGPTGPGRQAVGDPARPGPGAARSAGRTLCSLDRVGRAAASKPP